MNISYIIRYVGSVKSAFAMKGCQKSFVGLSEICMLNRRKIYITQ
ncbi:hypothetical protein MNV_1230037 [Candidatus Methanoperedens nitroreducens]|uniref:Uncharacterized protein n=1 Tax=Candidatus Methanoperedens nitratireducens TaxID=1392998 RepID=A0A284VJX8_9EURY|nr:hypothetical protein MNV_1230037 [Candidatus Methanoperedens nitroreducens]